MKNRTTTTINDISSAFARIGESIIKVPFFGATYITIVLLLLVLATRFNTVITLIALVWTVAYLLECVICINRHPRQ